MDVHVSSIASSEQSLSEAEVQSNVQSDHDCLLVVSTSDSAFCRTTMYSVMLQRPFVQAGSCVKRKKVQPARMGALLQQLEVKGFSEKSLGFQQHLGDPLQTESMTTDGFTLLTGPQDKDLICLTLLPLKKPIS